MKRLFAKSIAVLTVTCVVFSGIHATALFASTSELTLGETQQPAATLTLEQANVQTVVPQNPLPSGAAVQNPSPLSLPDRNPPASLEATPPVSVIVNGDFSQKTSGNSMPDGWSSFWTTAESVPGYLSSYDGRTGVVDLSLSRAGRGMKQTYSAPIQLDGSSLFDITFKVVSATLTGDGWYGTEAPVVLRVNGLRADGSAYQVTRYFNYANDADSAANPNFVLVPQNQWVTRSFTSQELGLVAGDKVTEVDVYGAGWAREAYVDSVNLSLDQVPPVTISLTGVQTELLLGTDMTVTAVADHPVDAYRWFLDGALIPDAITSAVTVGRSLTAGTHSLAVETTLGGVATTQSTPFKVIDLAQLAQLDIADQYAPARTTYWANDITDTFVHGEWDPHTGTTRIEYYPIGSSTYTYRDSLQVSRSYDTWAPPADLSGYTHEERALVEFDLSRWYQLGLDPAQVARVELLATVSGSGEAFQGYDFSIGSMQALEDGLFTSAQDDFNVSRTALQTVSNLQLNFTPQDLHFNITDLLRNDLESGAAWSGIVFKADAANLSVMQLANLRLNVYYDTNSPEVSPAQPAVTSNVPAATNQNAITLSGTKDANASIWINGVQAVVSDSSTVWTATVTLAAEGNNLVNITAKDTVGLVSSALTLTVLRDTLAPTGVININSGAAYATSQTVILNLSGTDNGSGIGAMSFSTDNMNWTAVEAYATLKTFTLPAGDGAKTVYVKYYDRAGNASVIYSSSIQLDTLPPTGTININSGAAYATSRTLTLNLSNADTGSGINTMSFSSDGTNWTVPEACAASRNFTLPAGDGPKTVYVKYYDKAGNVSVVYSKSIALDTLPPTGTININSGAASTLSQTVTLNLSGTDGGSGISTMSFSTDNAAWTAAEAYAASKTFTLPSGNGPQTVYVKFFDAIGNVSAVYSKTISLADPQYPMPDTENFYAGRYYPGQMQNGISVSQTSPGIYTYHKITSNGWVGGYVSPAFDGSAYDYVTLEVRSLASGSNSFIFEVKNEASYILRKTVSLQGTDWHTVQFLFPKGAVPVNFIAFSNPTNDFEIRGLRFSDTPVFTGTASVPVIQTSPTVTNTLQYQLAYTLNGVSFQEALLLKEGNNTVTRTWVNASGTKVTRIFSILADTVKPAGSININSSSLNTASQTVTLNLSGTDSGSGISTMSFSTDGTNWTAPATYATSKTFTLSSGDGTKTVFVKYYDKAGNASAVYSKSILLDMTPPAGAIDINAGAVYASSAAVILNLYGADSGSGITKMSFSTNGSTWTTAEAYAAAKTFTLSSVNGAKTVYVKYYDKAGNVSAVYSKSIILDTVAPVGTVKMNGGAAYTHQTVVTLDLTATDAGSGVSQMSFSTNGTTWTEAENYETSKVWTLVSGDGVKKVYVKFQDAAGKWSSAVSTTVTLDTVTPAGSININSGAAYASSQTVTLNLSGTDGGSGVSSMSFSTDGTSWAAPVAYTATKTFALPAGDGPKTVYVKYFDKAGNVSAVYSRAIILDTLPPAGTIQVNGGAQSIHQAAVTLNLSASDSGSGLAKMSFSTNGTTWTTAENYAATKAWKFSAGNGVKKVYVKFQDKSGKWSVPIFVQVVLDTTALLTAKP